MVGGLDDYPCNPVVQWDKWDYGGMKSETGGCRGRDIEMQAIPVGKGNRWRRYRGKWWFVGILCPPSPSQKMC